MKKTFFLPITATIIGILLTVSFGYSLKFITHADSTDTEWQLTINGLVEHSLNLTLTDIINMPQTTVYAKLICVGPPNFLVSEGNWTGVRLWLLLEEAGILPETVKIAFHAQDRYTTDLPLNVAQRDDVVLAYEKDGVPLSETLRLVVPGCWGYKWIAQVIRIEPVNYNFLGMYESLGYSDEAYIKPYEPMSTPPVSSSNPNLPLIPPSMPPNSSPSPSNSPSSPPSLTPTNSSSPLSSQQQDPQSNKYLPMDAFYVMAAVALIMVVFPAAIVLNKRANRQRIH